VAAACVVNGTAFLQSCNGYFQFVHIDGSGDCELMSLYLFFDFVGYSQFSLFSY